MPAPERFEIRDVDDADWAAFCATAVGTTPFSTPGWVRAAAAARDDAVDGGTVVRFLGAYHDGQLLAGVAGCEQGRGWRRGLVTPDLLPHTGFLFRPATSQRAAHVESARSAATTALAQHLRQRYPRVHLTHAPGLIDARPFLWDGWEVTPRYTYRIDLPADRQVVWDAFERRTRTAVRKAQKAGYVVEPTDDADELRRLYGEVYGGEGTAPVPGAVVEAMGAAALADGRAHGWRCRRPDADTAAIVLFVDAGDTLYAWVAGADAAQRDSGAVSLLYWHVLETTRCARFDFVGANLPSVAFFKRGFGGDLVPYVATVSRRSRPLRLASALRRALRGG